MSACCRSVYTRHLRDHYGVDRHWWPRIRAPRMVCVYGVDLRSKYKPGFMVFNCLTAIGHKSGSPIHRDGPLVACIYLAFSTNNIYCYWLMRGRLLCANPKRAFKSAWCTLFPLLSTAGKQVYNFLKNVNITDVISSLQVSSFFIWCYKVAEMIL